MARRAKGVERTKCIAITQKGYACSISGYKGSNLCYGHWFQAISPSMEYASTYDEVIVYAKHALGYDLPDFVYDYLHECFPDPIFCHCGVMVFPGEDGLYSWANYCPYCGASITQEVKDRANREIKRTNRGILEAKL